MVRILTMGIQGEHILSLDDAMRLSGPLAFNVMVKPVGSACNLNCRYCYYLDKSRLSGGRQEVMSLDVLERIIRDYLSSNETPYLTFDWHGGEPLAAGLEFFRAAVELQKKCSTGQQIQNSIQTNGTLITPQWAEFFRENDFLVGISIDGPQDIHDRFRTSVGGHSTFDRVMSGLMCLREHGVRFNTMTTVSSAGEGRGAEVYAFLKSIGSHYMQFMPVMEFIKPGPDGLRDVIARPGDPDGRQAPWSVTAEGFGRFMCDIFDQWVRNDVGEYYVNLFDAVLAGWCGVPPGLCIYNSVCGANLVIEQNGDVYPCDHFVYEDTCLGNVRDVSLREMALSQPQLWFGLHKRNSLPHQCLACDYLHLCHGECPKHRFSHTASGQPGLNSLCAGYKMFFEHTEPYMLEMKRLLAAGLPPSMIMSSLHP